MLSEAAARREEMLTEARERSTGMVAEAQQRKQAVLQELAVAKGAIEGKIEELRGFEKNYRHGLKSYIKGALTDLEHKPEIVGGPNEHQGAQQDAHAAAQH